MSGSCTNYGFVNGSACACPVGFGGSDCSQPACGGNIFQGSSRNLVPQPTAANTFANLTAAGCSCEDGWSGTGCNVCQTANACQAGYSSVVHQDEGPSAGLSDGQNHTLVCNTAPRVYAASQMSCVVQVRLRGLLSRTDVHTGPFCAHRTRRYKLSIHSPQL